MGIPGTKPMPRNLRVIRGLDKKLPTSPEQSAIPEQPIRVPPPPEDLNPEQATVFTDLARKLAGMRIMTDAYVDAIAVYSRNWCDARTARRRIDETGLVVRSPKGFPMPNPYLPIARKAEAVCFKIMSEFGLTASSQNRV